jgi:hypothetical protein
MTKTTAKIAKGVRLLKFGGAAIGTYAASRPTRKAAGMRTKHEISVSIHHDKKPSAYGPCGYEQRITMDGRVATIQSASRVAIANAARFTFGLFSICEILIRTRQSYHAFAVA